VEAATARVQQAALRPNPMLELGDRRPSARTTTSTSGCPCLDLNGRKEGRVAVAERELDTKRRQVADRERRLRADVRMKAGEVLAAQRSFRVIEDLLRVNRDGLTVVGNRVREGRRLAGREPASGRVNRLDASRQLAQSRIEVAALQLKALPAWRGCSARVKGDLAPSPLR